MPILPPHPKKSWKNIKTALIVKRCSPKSTCYTFAQMMYPAVLVYKNKILLSFSFQHLSRLEIIFDFQAWKEKNAPRLIYYNDKVLSFTAFLSGVSTTNVDPHIRGKSKNVSCTLLVHVSPELSFIVLTSSMRYNIICLHYRQEVISNEKDIL